MANRSGILAAFFLLALLLAGYWLGRAIKQAMLEPYQGYARTVFVEIQAGSGRIEIASALAAAGVVRSRWPFLVLAYFHHGRTLKAGEYFFDRPMTPREVFQKITRGEIFHYTVTVPEGYSMYDIAELVGRMGIFKPEEFLAAANDPEPIRDLAPRAHTLEGFLFPDTYQVTRRQTPRDLQAAMVRRFREVWASLEKQPGNPLKLAPLEIVTLASLVEKETGEPDERTMVAGVFYNRLRRRLALECDPTVIYAARLAGQIHGAITRSDLRRASPYNTYLHIGLPPGPIANPGRAALDAVYFPQPTHYLYFVSNTQGGHFFSRTLAEHNRNVARYRSRLPAQSGSAGRIAPKRAAPQNSSRLAHRAAGARP